MLERIVTPRSSSPSRLRRLFSGKSSSAKSQPPMAANGDVASTSASCSSSMSSLNNNAPASTCTRLGVIVVCVDQGDLDAFYACATACAVGWYMLAPDQVRVRARLLRCCDAVLCAPAMAIVDTTRLEVVTRDARRALAADPDGTGFPW